MRNPDRIDAVIDALKQLWQAYPDWRFGQLVENVANQSELSQWMAEDDKWLSALQAMLDGPRLAPLTDPGWSATFDAIGKRRESGIPVVDDDSPRPQKGVQWGRSPSAPPAHLAEGVWCWEATHCSPMDWRGVIVGSTRGNDDPCASRNHPDVSVRLTTANHPSVPDTQKVEARVAWANGAVFVGADVPLVWEPGNESFELLVPATGISSATALEAMSRFARLAGVPDAELSTCTAIVPLTLDATPADQSGRVVGALAAAPAARRTGRPVREWPDDAEVRALAEETGVSNLRMPGGFLNEVSGDLLGTHFLHQVRESGGTIWITESDGTEVCFPLDSTLPDVLLAAVVAAVGAWKARNSHLQSDVAEPPETTSADDEEEMRAQVVDMIWHASQKEYRAGWHPMIEYALVGHTGAWPLLAARTGWPAAFDDCKRPAGWTTWQAAQAARDEHRAWAQRFFHDDTMPSTEARPELGTSVSPAAPSDLPTQHFLRCSGCAARMRLDAVHTDTRGTIVWAAWECAHTRIVQWYPGDPLRIESLSGVGNPWRRPPADTKRSPFHE